VNEKKQIAINLISSVVSFAVSMGISFFLSPYIINNVGNEAYGFVSLGNQFVSYIQIITVALNSMASRFVTIKLYENNEQEAKVYFSSVFFANVIMALVSAIPLTIVVVFLENFLNIPVNIISDVKILWTLIFINFLITLIVNVFSIATYARNRLELNSLRNIESNILKAVLLVGMYYFFRPSVIYIGIGALVSTAYVAVLNLWYTHKLLPEMKVKKELFKFKAVRELISAGMWNSLTSLSTTLLAGLDLLITNIFINANVMGILSIAKTIPTAINQLLGTIPGAFSPQFVIDYARNDHKKLLKDINSAIKIMSVISCIPLVGLAVFGKPFFRLWVPTQDADLLHLLSILTVAATFFTAPIKPLYTIYTVTNKVKMESISVLIQGILSTIIVFILLFVFKESSEVVQLCIVAGVSTALGIIRCLTFTPLYAAYCLKVSKFTFYPVIGKAMLSFVLLFLIESFFGYVMPTNTWLNLIIAGIVASIVGVIVNLILILNKEERLMIFSKVKNKFSK